MRGGSLIRKNPQRSLDPFPPLTIMVLMATLAPDEKPDTMNPAASGNPTAINTPATTSLILVDDCESDSASALLGTISKDRRYLANRPGTDARR